jgi:hypothetical protein
MQTASKLIVLVAVLRVRQTLTSRLYLIEIMKSVIKMLVRVISSQDKMLHHIKQAHNHPT